MSFFNGVIHFLCNVIKVMMGGVIFLKIMFLVIIFYIFISMSKLVLLCPTT